MELKYSDEIRGAEGRAGELARVVLVEDMVESDKSVDADTLQKAAVAGNRIAKEKALEAADAGRHEEAASLLSRQRSFNASLPQAAQSELLAEENKALEAYERELKQDGNLGKENRKKLQYENYQDKYQKRAL